HLCRPLVIRLARESFFPSRRSSDLAWAVEIVILIPVAVEPVVQLPLLHQQILVHQAASFSKTRNAIISVSAVCSLRVYDLHTPRSEEHTSELQSRFDLVCRLLLAKK